ncbi:MAG: NUDIX hydrolase [Chromatiales bacterium]|nr:NUDIX hydrolase [Chromatiales bacterium]
MCALSSPAGAIPSVKFCSQCGSKVRLRVPDEDTMPRHVCDSCGTVHYENPKIVVGCVPEVGQHVLLCRRAIEPRRGYWTIPAGFMENGETMQQGAARETLEEAMATVEMGELFAIIDVVHARQVHMMFRARMIDESFGAGLESLETKLFLEEEVPWADIAFPSVRFALEKWFEDRSLDRRMLHSTVLDRRLR